MRRHTSSHHHNSSDNGKLAALSGVSATRSRRAHNAARAKCSSSRSLYFVDDNEFDASSRLEILRRRAGTLYRAVEREFQQPRSRHVVKKAKHVAASSSSSSFSRARKLSLPLCVEAVGRRNAGRQLCIDVEVPAAGEEMCRKRNKEEEEEESDAKHDGTEQRLRLQEETRNSVCTNVQKNDLSDHCSLKESGEFPLRKTSGRHVSEAFVPGKFWSSSLRSMDYNENSAKSKFTSAPSDVDMSPLSDHLPSLLSAAAVPFKWEEAPGKPKRTATAEQKTKVRCLSRQGIELNSFVEADVHFQTAGVGTAMDLQSDSSRRNDQEFGSPLLKSRRNSGDQGADVGEHSHRYYGRVTTHNREKTSGLIAARSSRCLSPQDNESHIDLVAPAAAKFLVQETSYVSPLTTPPHHAFDSPAAVPFKWEETPGKPKVDAEASKPRDILQLPPRLAIPQPRHGIGSSSSFSARPLRNHSLGGPFAGFFSPCRMNVSSSPSRRHATAPPLSHSCSSFKGSMSLPRKLSTSSSRASYCSSLDSPSEDCQINNPKAVFENSPLRKISNRSAFSAPLASTYSPSGLQPRSLYNSSELKASSHPAWIHTVGTAVRAHEGAAHAAGDPMMNSSPTSTLYGPETESLSQTSASNPSLSGYLDASARPGSTPFSTSHATHSKTSSSHASYESVEEDFDHEPTTSCSLISYNNNNSLELGGCRDSSSSSLRDLGPGRTQRDKLDQTHGAGPRGSSSTSVEAVKALMKLCRSGTCFNMPMKPSTSNDIKFLGATIQSSHKVEAPGTQTKSFQCMELNPNSTLELNLSNQLDKHASYLQHTLTQKENNVRVQDQASKPQTLPIPNTIQNASRLPYTMPAFVVEQELATRGDFHEPPETNFAAHLGATTGKHTHGEIFTLQKRYNASERSKLPSTKLQQGVHFIFSMCCKALKRVLFRQPQQPQQLRKLVAVEPKLLWYHDDIPLTEFQFVKPT